MKVKAVVSGLSEEMVAVLNRLRPTILESVVGPDLKRPNISSAGFYVQECDVADEDTHKPFVEVRMSGVSCTDDRSYIDLMNARKHLEDVYAQAIFQGMSTGDIIDLFVILMLDSAPKAGASTLIEGEVKTIKK